MISLLGTKKLDPLCREEDSPKLVCTLGRVCLPSGVCTARAGALVTMGG